MLAPRTLVPSLTLLAALRGGGFLAALLAFTALAAEALIVVLPRIPFNAAQVWVAGGRRGSCASACCGGCWW